MTTITLHPRHLSEDAGRLSLLLGTLRRAAAAGSDRRVILAWAEVIAAWHDLEVHAYVDDLRGHFVHEAALPDADLTAVPSVIPTAALQSSAALTALTKRDAERLQFTASGDVVICLLAASRGWLLAVSGTMTADAEAALALYVRLLEESMTYGTLASVGRMTGAMVGHLFADDDNALKQAELAMDTLRQTLGLNVASLIVRSAAGAPLIAVDDWHRTGMNASNPGSRLVVLRHSVDRYSLALGIAKPDGRQVTPQETRVVEKAADLLELWTQRLVRRAAGTLERRADPRRFDEFVEGLALQALDRNAPVTALVVSLRARSLAASGLECTARLRKGLRSSDLVGMLSDGEIGLLLHNTEEPGGRLVEMRVHEMLRTVPCAAGTTDGIVVGLAARMPREARSPILKEARARAAQQMVKAAG